MTTEQINNAVVPEVPAVPKADKKNKKAEKPVKNGNKKEAKKADKGTKVEQNLKAASKKIDLNKVITVLAPENPKREGTKCREWFDWYKRGKKGMTVEAYIKKGGKLGDIRWDLKKGYISLS